MQPPTHSHSFLQHINNTIQNTKKCTYLNIVLRTTAKGKKEELIDLHERELQKFLETLIFLEDYLLCIGFEVSVHFSMLQKYEVCSSLDA